MRQCVCPVTDMHIHILPGVDDGAQDDDMSRRMLRIAYDEGIRCIIATPHNMLGRYEAAPDIIRKKLAALRQMAQLEGLEGLALHEGMELFWDSTLPDRLKSGEALTLAGSRYCLVEFHPLEEFGRIKEALRRLYYMGYRPVLAHCERYACLMQKERGGDLTDRAAELADGGIHLQVNASSVRKGGLFGKGNDLPYRFVRALLKEELVSLIGTDAHRDAERAPRIADCCRLLLTMCDEDYARAIVHENAQRVIEDKDL